MDQRFEENTATKLRTVAKAGMLHHERLNLDNVRDHRARTSDLPFQNHAQVGLRVHRIVIRRLAECPSSVFLFYARR